MLSVFTVNPAGNPSTNANMVFPCDSPAVQYLSGMIGDGGYGVQPELNKKIAESTAARLLSKVRLVRIAIAFHASKKQNAQHPQPYLESGKYSLVKFFIKYWFLFCLALALVIGYLFANSLESVSSWVWLRRSIVMSVMFLMALPLPLAMITRTIRRPGAALLATAVSFILLPVIAWGMANAINISLYAGFLVVAATPSTLASAAVWTRRAGGNEVTALMTTVLTNSISFVVTPLIVLLLLGQQANVDFGDMVARLGLLVLLPMVAAQLFAARKSVADWAQDNKKALGVSAQIGILMIVLLGTAQSTLKMPDEQTSGIGITIVLVLVCALLHIVVLYSGFVIAKALGFSREDQIAVAISGSQKTLMIGLLVCIQLNVSLVPMVVYHATQLVIDTFVADGFSRKGD